MTVPRIPRYAGGLASVFYTLRKGWEAGGLWKLYRRLRLRNACKTCALGMGGQAGGMVNEKGHFPEFCKKSVQAQAGDMQGGLSETFFARTPIEAMERLSSAQFERLGRLAFPLMAGPQDTHYRRIGWDEALDRAAQGFRESVPEETFFYMSGRSSNEAAFLLQLIARAYGTSNIHNCSFYCHQASGIALHKVYGSSTASVVLEDLSKADLAVVAGANPASNHPRLITQLVELRRRGGQVIVINPVKELGMVRFRIPSDWRSMLLGSEVCDLYLQPNIGSDIALFKGILKALIESRSVDADFVRNHTGGWDAVRADAEAADWSELVGRCGLSRGKMEEAARRMSGARHGILMWAMGLTHHRHGVDNVLALSNLALARGWLGKPGAGLIPIRGHSNVQGIGTVGVAPEVKAAFAQSMETVYGIPVSAESGQDTYASMVAAHRGRIHTALMLGGNLFASNPDRGWAAQALRNIAQSVSITTKLNEGHVLGRGRTALILPCLARDEEMQPTTQESMFNYVRLSDGGAPNVSGEMRSEVDILAALAERILPPGRFDRNRLHSHAHLRGQMAQVVPGMAPVADIDRTGREFHMEGRTFHRPEFPTPDGRARFHVTPLEGFLPEKGEFRLMTLRSEGQFNSVVYEEDDRYRGVRGRDVVMMCPDDAVRLGIRPETRVCVETATGRLTVRVALIDIAPGNLAMYYPEANALVPAELDPTSKTPAFKSIRARVRAA